MNVTLSKRLWNEAELYKPNEPCWFPCTTGEAPAKPIIRCNCGQLIGLLNHHVHADGTVTASFLHDVAGCGWHVFITLEDWSSGEFPVNTR